MSEDKLTHVLENEFPLIPMSEIDDMARKLSVAWMECDDKNWIGQKHKLASDITNYHRIKSAAQQSYIKQLEQQLDELHKKYNELYFSYNQLLNIDKLK